MIAQTAGKKASVHPHVAAALADCRQAFWSVAVFSGAVNLLMLAGPLYMLQVYDRVLSSRSVPTLVALTIFLAGAYAFQGALEVVRSRIVTRSAALLDDRLGADVHASVMRLAIVSRKPGDTLQPVRDLDQIRAFLTSAGPIAIVDLPWMPVFLIICFLIHPWIGLLSLAGAIVLSMLTFATERASRAPAVVLAQETAGRAAMIDADRRNSESVIAMGMEDVLCRRWLDANDRYVAASARASDVVGGYGSVSKIVRLLLQSLILGVGAYLVIRGEMSAGSMIAASIMMGRALAPIDMAIANWRSFIAARQSIGRLSSMLGAIPVPSSETALPKPQHTLQVDQVTVVAPGGTTPILRDIRFQLGAGEALGVVGPSGAGKTSLVRALVGIWPPARGLVRIDGAALDQWDRVALGAHIGFVSQAIDLFDGTVARNIARMASEPDSEAVLRAARAAGVHEMILKLPQGYDTPVGEAAAALSAGQRQRIALARALYGEPFFVVLDEPYSNLDLEGETAVTQAVRNAKARGAIVILVAHRPSALEACDKVLLLVNGMQQAFGARDEILQKIMPRPVTAAGNLKVVSDTGSPSER